MLISDVYSIPPGNCHSLEILNIHALFSVIFLFNFDDCLNAIDMKPACEPTDYKSMQQKFHMSRQSCHTIFITIVSNQFYIYQVSLTLIVRTSFCNTVDHKTEKTPSSLLSNEHVVFVRRTQTPRQERSQTLRLLLMLAEVESRLHKTFFSLLLLSIRILLDTNCIVILYMFYC